MHDSQLLLSIIMDHQHQWEFPMQKPLRLLQGSSFIDQRNKATVRSHYFRGFINSLDYPKYIFNSNHRCSLISTEVAEKSTKAPSCMKKDSATFTFRLVENMLVTVSELSFFIVFYLFFYFKLITVGGR